MNGPGQGLGAKCLFGFTTKVVEKVRPLNRGSLVVVPDALRHVFSFLSGRKLAELCSVSKTWHETAPESWNLLNPHELAPRCRVFGPDVWNGVEKSLFSEFPSNIEIIDHLREMQGSVAVISIPQGMTLNRLIEVAKADGVRFRFVAPPVLSELGDSPAAAETVMISIGVLPGSRNLSVVDQQALLTVGGHTMPTVIQAVALCVLTNLTFVEPRERPLSDNPLTYTRCKNQVGGWCHVVVAGFASSGLGVSYCYGGFGSIGVVGLRKFGGH